MGKKRKRPTPKTSVWAGPSTDGISQTLINKWMECRERARLYMIEGLKEEEGYRSALEFGNMWHEAEEHHAKAKSNLTPLKAAYLHSRKLVEQYPGDEYKIDCDYRRMKVLWAHYVDYWKAHADVKARKPVYQEESFHVPYRLPHSGRWVTLRGKFDSVDIIDKKIYLQENKTKGRIDSPGITATLDQNLQTMFYITALEHLPETQTAHAFPVRFKNDMVKALGGVRYNVIYNSGHMVGGKKTTEQMYAATVNADPNKFFMRWRVEIPHSFLRKFQQRVINSILEQIYDWYEWVSSPEGLKDPFANPIHFQTPWGLYNSLASGFRGSYFNHLTTGNKEGLVKVDTLFPELELV